MGQKHRLYIEEAAGGAEVWGNGVLFSVALLASHTSLRFSSFLLSFAKMGTLLPPLASACATGSIKMAAVDRVVNIKWDYLFTITRAKIVSASQSHEDDETSDLDGR